MKTLLIELSSKSNEIFVDFLNADEVAESSKTFKRIHKDMLNKITLNINQYFLYEEITDDLHLRICNVLSNIIYDFATDWDYKINWKSY